MIDCTGVYHRSTSYYKCPHILEYLLYKVERDLSCHMDSVVSLSVDNPHRIPCDIYDCMCDCHMAGFSHKLDHNSNLDHYKISVGTVCHKDSFAPFQVNMEDISLYDKSVHMYDYYRLIIFCISSGMPILWNHIF